MVKYLKNNLGLEILTDSGWQAFDGVVNKGFRHTITLDLEYTSITVTPDHKIYINDETSVPAESIIVGSTVITESGTQKVIAVRENEITQVYDIVNAGPDRRFFANEILCSNCEFIIADETLINPNTLLVLEGKEPNHRLGQVRWYEQPKKGDVYVIALDPSLGTGGDPAAIQIFDASTTTQIGEWKHNKTDIPGQVRLMADICKHIAEKTSEPNNIYYSIERNGVGEAAIVSLAEYGESNISGTFLSESGRGRRGFVTTQKPKLAACAKFKTLLESKKMTIHSIPLISELKTFVASGGSYAAKTGETDDLVMSALLAVRMMQSLSDYYGDLESQIRDHDEMVSPLPFFAVIS